jgi:hypothetical protein
MARRMAIASSLLAGIDVQLAPTQRAPPLSASISSKRTTGTQKFATVQSQRRVTAKASYE